MALDAEPPRRIVPQEVLELGPVLLVAAQAPEVFVTANYKLSFDHLRKNLEGMKAWILVLDTKGINVWCAAGKGTFSTKELVNRIKLTNLDQLVIQRRLILPQLGAVGVSSHQVKKDTEPEPSSVIQSFANTLQSDKGFQEDSIHFQNNKGFTVIFGPVRAADIKDFVKAGYKATKEMRKVNFSLVDRAKLVPVDFVYRKYYLLAALTLVFILSGLNKTGISFNLSLAFGLQAVLNLFLAYAVGIVLTPILLPFIPGRPFALKGFLAGTGLFIILWFFEKTGNNFVEIISWFLLITAVAAFVAAVLVILVPAVKADDVSWPTAIYFEQPVRIGADVFPAGSYILQRCPNQVTTRLMKIYSVDRGRWEGLIMGVSARRSGDPRESVVTFEKQGHGEPDTLRYWFYESWNIGFEFPSSNRKTSQTAKNGSNLVTVVARSAAR